MRHAVSYVAEQPAFHFCLLVPFFPSFRFSNRPTWLFSHYVAWKGLGGPLNVSMSRRCESIMGRVNGVSYSLSCSLFFREFLDARTSFARTPNTAHFTSRRLSNENRRQRNRLTLLSSLNEWFEREFQCFISFFNVCSFSTVKFRRIAKLKAELFAIFAKVCCKLSVLFYKDHRVFSGTTVISENAQRSFFYDVASPNISVTQILYVDKFF